LREERRKARSIERRMARMKAPNLEKQEAAEGRASSPTLGGDR
jgi:hypothetical protein